MKKKWILPAAFAVCVLAVAVMVSALALGPEPRQLPFTPPPFETDAVTGAPQVPDALGYSRIYQDGMTFFAWICGNVTMEGNAATVYFTNPEENTVWLKLRVLDERGNILGETGLLCPGEYVETVALAKRLPTGTKIKLKIMAYEPDTYYSEGAVTMNTTIGAKNDE